MGQISRGTDTSTSVLHVTWAALTGDDEGGSMVLSYFLQYKSTSSNNWITLLGGSADSKALEFRVTSGVVAGSQYNFRILARNKYGSGQYSDI